MKADTIYAPSSAIGGAIALLRISGPDAASACAILDRDIVRVPRILTFAHVMDGEEPVDDCMAVFLPGPHTYTGEDMLEINCHGGMQTVQRLLGMLNRLGLRPAEGGEFTRRAFLNGKMDLSQAEAVMDVITAAAEQSRKAALQQLHGSVSRTVAELEQQLVDALSAIDAAIDYPDEAEAEALEAVPQALNRVIGQMQKLLDEGRRGRLLRDGLQVAFLGRPNVGKSSLLNALLGEDRAIVTALPGTTRDVLSERTAFCGVPVRLIDTAGLRETDNEAERMGVDRARRVMQQCDVLCVVVDGSVALTDDDQALLAETAGTARIILINKCDLPLAIQPDALGLLPQENVLYVSAKSGAGLDALQARLVSLAGPENQDCNCITNERHLHLLEQALSNLIAGRAAAQLDCMATDIRTALHALGGVTGTDVDARVIDRVFERFCVGK